MEVSINKKLSNVLNLKKSKISPLLLMVPHSGRNYDEIYKKQSNLLLSELRKSEDSYIDLLFQERFLDFNYLKANFPRIMVDVNRSPLEIDLSMWDLKENLKLSISNSQKVIAGIGVFPKISFSGKSIYRNKLPFSEARRRLLKYYFPYHKSIKLFIKAMKKKHKDVIMLDCHSMSSEIVSNNIDIILSDNLGKSSHIKILDLLKHKFVEYGYNVEINNPFKGGFITKYYGDPKNNIHSIQIEINKKIYLQEKIFELKKERFNDLKNCFIDIINYINSSKSLL